MVAIGTNKNKALHVVGSLWNTKRHELSQWIFYNLVIGLCPIFLSWLVLGFGHKTNFEAPFIDGTLLIFSVILSGTSMSFFQAETQRKLKESEGYVFNLLVIAILSGATGFSTIVAIKELSPSTVLYNDAVKTASILIFLIAVGSNFWLACIRLAYDDPNLLAALKGKIGEDERAKIAEQSNIQKNVDGVKL